MKKFIYMGIKTREISFPLGGIGTGCIGLSGDGRLIDWEIYNKPNKGSRNGFSHFAVKAESGGKVLDAKVLNGDLQSPYSGRQSNFGFGPDRHTMAGMPHFKDTVFEGNYPFAKINFEDNTFPGNISLVAFNPFIPLNDKDSSIPAAFFELEAKNTTSKEIAYTFALSLSSPPGSVPSANSYTRKENIHFFNFKSTQYNKNDIEFGDISIATDAKNVHCQENWFRGRWFDSLDVFWQDFTRPGAIRERNYKTTTVSRECDTGTLTAKIVLKPGEKKSVHFVIAWNFPNVTNYWNPIACSCENEACSTDGANNWKNYYATVFSDSQASAAYSLIHWDRLFQKTKTFHDALFSSTLPDEALDAVSANVSILKSPTCLRLENGEFYGFEGCKCDGGCCEGSCTHVWNYAYALPFLFPALERSMRELDFTYNQREDGGMAFRLQLPLGRKRSEFRPCADGQFGGVIKAYRDWKISGDDAWLKRNWESIRKSIDFAWAPTNEDKWDADRDGVLEGRQHHTLDMELFGPNSWLTGFYLAALKAGAEMAAHIDENDTAKEYMQLFEKGKEWVEKNLFNGRYYCQSIDLEDKSILEKYNSEKALTGSDAINTYWNDETGEIKYQVGEGCIIDQVLAQWHANLCGLGEIYEPEKVKKSLESIYKYNFKTNFRYFANPCRLYSLNKESGTVICAWPDDVRKPVIPIPYSQETMCGFEYQAAVHMIQEGMIEQGMELVKAVRGRFDGENRNPWNEFECGSNYARSMASYALLNAFSGFEFDMVRGMIGFNPILFDDKIHRTIWSLDPAWGTFMMDPDKVEIEVKAGMLKLQSLKLPEKVCGSIVNIKHSGRPVEFIVSGQTISFIDAVVITEGKALVVNYMT